MEVFIKIVQFIASLSLLVLVHEFGHFIFAKIFGVRVEKFYIFFDYKFSLLKFRIGETEFGVGWIPFGGYCKLSGMIDESMDLEQMKEPPKSYEFRSKPSWQRLIIMVGGVFMNVLTAIIIYIGLTFSYGDRYFDNADMIHGSMFSPLAQEAGFRNGDRVLSVGGTDIRNYRMIYPEIVINNAPDVKVLRDGQEIAISIPKELMSRMLNEQGFMVPRIPFVLGRVAEQYGAAGAGLQPLDSLVAVNGEEKQFYDQFVEVFRANKGETVELTYVRTESGVMNEYTVPVAVDTAGIIGVIPYDESRFYPVRTQNYTLLQSVPKGLRLAGTEISNYWKQIKLMFKPKTEAYKSIGGFLSIGNIFPGYWSWELFWRITAFISIALAVINILPIPALDGGHVMFLLYEMITGRKPSDRFMEWAQLIGLLLLFTLIIYANGNDIYRFFIKG